MKNEIRITISEDGSVEVDTTRVQGNVEEVRKILEDLASRLGPITKERHIPGHHHHHDGLREHITGG